MNKNKSVKFTLILANALVIILLVCFLFKGFYQSGYNIAVSGKGDYYFNINPCFQFLVILSIIFPVLIAFFRKKYIWLTQALVIILISISWKEDFLQKTLFINQPTSKAKVHKIVTQFIDKNETHINGIIDPLTANCKTLIKDYDGVTTIQNIKGHDPNFIHSETDTIYTQNGTTLRYIKTGSLSSDLTQTEEYEIKLIVLEKGEIVRLELILNQPKAKKYYQNYISYYPQGIKKPITPELYKLNTNYYLEQERTYSYKELWVVYLSGPFVKG